MFGKFTEQVKKSSQPMGSLVALNTKMLESFSQQQTEFFTGFMADSVKYVESVSVQTEVKGVVAAQTAYAEAVKERLAHASKETYGKMNEMRDEYTAVLKTSLNELPKAQELSEEMVKAATATQSQAKKAEPKKKPAKATSAKKTESKNTATSATKATSPKQAKKPATKTAEVSAAKAPEVKPKPKKVAEAPKKVAEAPKAEQKTKEVKAAPVNAANTPAPQTRVAPKTNSTSAPKTAAKK